MAEHIYIKFYGISDFTSRTHLHETEAIIRDWDKYIKDADINSVSELYNIKKYFDAGARLDCWNDEQYNGFLEKCNNIPRIIGKFFSTISDENFDIIHDMIVPTYLEDFWELICVYKVYKRITPDTIEHLLTRNEQVVWRILIHKELSAEFGQIIAEHLKQNKYTPSRLITRYLAQHENGSRQIFFPAEFTQEMRDRILADYVEREDANINDLQLLEQAQSSKEFPLSDKLRLKARKKRKSLQETLLSNGVVITYGAEVTFKSIPDGSFESSFNDGMISCAYSREWIEENRDYPTLLNNFIYLFGYTDSCFRSTFVSPKNEIGIFERLLSVNGNKYYLTGGYFDSIRCLSLLQMAAYNRELERIGIRLEDIFRWFFEEYLKNEFNANGFTYTPPSAGTTITEKCKLLCIAIDGALKQYRLYCEDGVVDRELLEMSSGHIVFSELRSILKNKYAYSASDSMKNEAFFLFSDQSMMNYTEKTQEKYETLPELLLCERVKKDDFMGFQQINLDWLIGRNDISVSEDGYLTVNKRRVFLLKDLYEHEVICPLHYSKGLAEQADLLVSVGDLRYESTLFSKPEQDYLNYILNKAEFSNGLDLRNRYSHDTYAMDEKTQYQDYIELQKIMVLIIIKINEELCLKYQQEISNKSCEAKNEF